MIITLEEQSQIGSTRIDDFACFCRRHAIINTYGDQIFYDIRSTSIEFQDVSGRHFDDARD